MRPLSRLAVVASLACSASLGPAALALAAPGSGSVTTAPGAEAWYRAPQSCALPVGCPPTPPSQYAHDTLHVGVLLGQEEARTFLQLDLSALPPGTKPVGGQLRLPVATGSRDGTRSPQSAELRACLVSAAVEDADGKVGTGPEPKCDEVTTGAIFVPATAQTPAAFTVDLAQLAAAWETSSAPGALALLPAEGVASTDNWHVAFSDRTREGDGVTRINAAVSFVSSAVAVEQDPPPAVTAPVTSFRVPEFTAPDSFTGPSVQSFDVPIAAAAPAPVAQAPAPQTAPVAAAPQQVVRTASVIDTGFRYPAVFLLPLLFLAGAAWLGRALTRDLALQESLA